MAEMQPGLQPDSAGASVARRRLSLVVVGHRRRTRRRQCRVLGPGLQ